MKFFSRIMRAGLVCAVLSAAAAWAGLTADQAYALEAKAGAGDRAALQTLLADARQGNQHAQFGLAALYHVGWGVPQDYAQEAQWLRQAAQQGHAPAQFRLGLLYANGQGVPQNKAAAYALFTQSIARDASGDNPARRDRASLVSGMTAREIEAGQALARKMSAAGHPLQALDEYLGSSAGK